MKIMKKNLEIQQEFQTELKETVSQIVTDAMNGVAPVKEIPEYLSKGQVCEYLNISRATLDAWIRKGKAPRYALIGGVYQDRKSTRLNSSHVSISYAVFCLK